MEEELTPEVLVEEKPTVVAEELPATEEAAVEEPVVEDETPAEETSVVKKSRKPATPAPVIVVEEPAIPAVAVANPNRVATIGGLSIAIR